MRPAGRKRVALGVLRSRDRILLYLRDDRPHLAYPDYWAPLGGAIEDRETPERALRREIREEIGCEARDLAFMGSLEVEGDPLCEDHTIYMFDGEIDRDLKDMILTEGQRLGYFTREEFLGLKFPAVLRSFILAHSRSMRLENRSQ